MERRSARMIPAYEDFRAKSWPERVALFNAMSPEDKAELFRTQVSGWLERYREALTPAQIDVLAEAMTLCEPQLYAQTRVPALEERVKDFHDRAARVLSPAQFVEVLTMQWGPSCTRTQPPD